MLKTQVKSNKNSFGASLDEFLDINKNTTGMVDYNAIRIRNITAMAFLQIEEDKGNIENADDFISGINSDAFKKLIYTEHTKFPNFYEECVYLLEMDGVELKLLLHDKVILTKHNNVPGVLLILLSALVSKNINIIDCCLGKRNKIGYSAIVVNGDENVVNYLLSKLGNQYYEANLIEFHSR